MSSELEKKEFERCTSCNSGWQINVSKESCCGWCGTSIQGFELTCLCNHKDFLIYADEDGKFELEFQIENTGFATVSISQISLE